MQQFRRLDPLANAGPYQKIMASPVKSFSLTEAQFDRARTSRPDLVIIEPNGAVVGRLHQDRLEIHYGFADVETFREDFITLCEEIVEAVPKEQAPRGLVLSFRDRPNRMVADTVFWPLNLDEGPQWVEWNYVSVPEQPEPADEIEGGFRVRALTDADNAALATIDGEIRGNPSLTAAGVESLLADAKTVRLIEPAAGGPPVGYIYLRGEPGGWGIIDTVALPESAANLRGPLLRWAIAWLRNNGGRRIRQRALIDDSASIALLKETGFTPGETGLDYVRSMDPAQVRDRLEERKGHGTMIKFGDWR